MKNQPVEILIQPVVLHLEYFEKNLKKLDFAVKPIQPIVNFLKILT